MSNPPNNAYRKSYDAEICRKCDEHKSFHPHDGCQFFGAAMTANNMPIVDGLRVFTNNLDRGTVDLSRAEWEWHGPENRYHLWFDVVLDTSYKGEPKTGRTSQSDDRVTTRFEGKTA